ncbi:M20 family metallopeptidase [Moraxella haemolytica]|uniref:M20 aminoacylase family protein n=1 Tax=Moraxella haemolytica TaxID=2904119 RepID=UPI002542E3C4|nr:M20 aminoacylase family protein [Moraxella sp. ZY171148]WII95443.1 M20 family metallopeptidase [Moraxella sp. ZY171148]
MSLSNTIAINPQHLSDLMSEQAFFANIRQTIHQNPELGFEEVETSNLIAKYLTEWGYTLHRGLAKTGIVATLKNGNGDKVIGLRADMDALPIVEKTGKPYASQVAGKFHGCGHDGHSTILLACAKQLAKTRNFNGAVHLIFQPAEELLYGGRVMLEDGLFDKFPCDVIFAMHNMPRLATGEFYFKTGAVMASSDTLYVHVKGVGSHGAMPEYGIDATLVACHIAIALQSIVSRNVSPLEQAVITVGQLTSGNVPNVVNDSALLKLSVRTLNAEVRKKVLSRITEVVEFQAKSFGASAEVEHINGCPPTVNGSDATEFAVKVAQNLVGEDKVHTGIAPLMGSEDFAFMLEANPNGNYCFVGNGGGDSACMVHHPEYDFNDEIIATAGAYFCGLVENYLK